MSNLVYFLSRFAIPFYATLSIFLVACNSVPTSPLPKPPAGSWLVFLCKASDDATEPHPIQFYKDLFSKSSPDLLFQYFDAQSGGIVDVSTPDVLGWFPMAVTTAELSPLTRNNSTPVNRSQTARDCKTAAVVGLANSGRTVDIDNYVGLIAVINVPADSGDAGAKSLVVSQPENDIGFVSHEMLHVYGLIDHSRRADRDTTSDHTFWSSQPTGDYQDCWDMMSYLTCVYTFQTTRGPQGPELQAAYRQKLGWLPKNRVFEVAAYPPAQSTIQLAPIGAPNNPGYLMASVEVPNKGFYVVEYREPVGFDRGGPRPEVVIRELRTSRITYLVERQNGSIGWLAGERFTDIQNYISVTVNSVGNGSASITIDPSYSAGAANIGDICGDKFHGQVRACPQSSQCNPRVTPPLQSVDWFCM